MSPIWVHRNPLLFQHPGVFHVCILKQLLFFLSFLAMHHSLLSLSIILYSATPSRLSCIPWGFGLGVLFISVFFKLLCHVSSVSFFPFTFYLSYSLFFLYSLYFSIPIYFTYWCLVTLRRLSLIYILVTNVDDKLVSCMTIKQNPHDICDHSWMKLTLL